MSARMFKSDRHAALDLVHAPDHRLSHSALMRAPAPAAKPPALNPLQRLARGVRNLMPR